MELHLNEEPHELTGNQRSVECMAKPPSVQRLSPSHIGRVHPVHKLPFLFTMTVLKHRPHQNQRWLVVSCAHELMNPKWVKVPCALELMNPNRKDFCKRSMHWTMPKWRGLNYFPSSFTNTHIEHTSVCISQTILHLSFGEDVY